MEELWKTNSRLIPIVFSDRDARNYRGTQTPAGQSVVTINALEKEIDDMAARHEEEPDLMEQHGLVRSQVEQNALQHRRNIGRTHTLSAKYRRELNDALIAYTSFTNHLKDPQSEDKVKYDALLQIVAGLEQERKS